MQVTISVQHGLMFGPPQTCVEVNIVAAGLLRQAANPSYHKGILCHPNIAWKGQTDSHASFGFSIPPQDFVSAVMDVDYSPTGREFVAGAYDRSIRIFAYNGGHSREVYTTKRMQRVFCVRFSGDASYVFSGSDDMNVRVWKVSGLETAGLHRHH